MKTKLIIASIFLFAFFGSAQAQIKMAVIDTDYILNKIPQYQSAQNTLDALSKDWQEEIEKLFAEIDKMYKAYQAEAVLLPEDTKLKRQEAIIAKEREAKDLQRKRFGTEGDLFKKRQELIKPIQDRLANAIDEYATEGNYSVILDRSSSSNIMYANPRLEKSDDILKKLGL